jgi:anti-anti-sigma factor
MAISQFTDKSGQQWVVIPAPEYIDGTNGQKLLDLAQKLLEKGAARVALDLAGTRVVNSIGISRFIQMVETFAQEGGVIAFCGPNDTISRTFRIMGLLQKAHLVDSVEQAEKLLPLSD